MLKYICIKHLTATPGEFHAQHLTHFCFPQETNHYDMNVFSLWGKKSGFNH